MERHAGILPVDRCDSNRHVRIPYTAISCDCRPAGDSISQDVSNAHAPRKQVLFYTLVVCVYVGSSALLTPLLLQLMLFLAAVPSAMERRYCLTPTATYVSAHLTIDTNVNSGGGRRGRRGRQLLGSGISRKIKHFRPVYGNLNALQHSIHQRCSVTFIMTRNGELPILQSSI